MSIETEFRSALVQHAGLAALVGDRIYPVIAPDEVDKPYLVYHVIGGIPLVSFSGVNVIKNERIQVTAWARTYAEIRAIHEQVRAALLASAILSIVPLDDGIDDYEQDTKLYGIRSDYSVWY